MTVTIADDMVSRADEARYREAIYRNLSALFADAPGADALRALVEAARTVEVEDVRRASEAGFYAYLRELDGCDAGELRVEVASEYAELFVGPRPPLAPYYESVYLGFPNRLFTEQTMSVRRFYERCGLSVVKDGKVPDDHVAYELELMATLAGREAEAVEAGRATAALELERLQREFIVVHLGGWLGPFANRVAEAPCAGFYRALSRFAHEFAAEDDAALGASIQELERAAAAEDVRAESAETA
ncbi:MAG: molecular chaperone TorD family protein [Eggerthellaceae bacterium]|nr:molecular chaperone TorD family protein [Eggerthellaceae bacterium]